MGMVISFTCVTPAELEQAHADPGWAREFLDDLSWNNRRPGNPGVYLDKSWAGIQYLLDEAEAELDLQTDGIPITEEGTLSGWSAETVQAAAEELRALPFVRLAAHYDAARMTEEDVYPGVWDDGEGSDEDGSEDGSEDGELSYLRSNYEELVAFFDTTATTAQAAIMSFSF
ncbi:YfbM family protein [Streptomyces rimosus]|uniref:YfbM family protein n=1 Tax=Streptomyces rimosus TaxID=1927 RepID=UPI0004C67907|nr:YfbM family protein [Streptomyces rimosus]